MFGWDRWVKDVVCVLSTYLGNDMHWLGSKSNQINKIKLKCYLFFKKLTSYGHVLWPVSSGCSCQIG